MTFNIILKIQTFYRGDTLLNNKSALALVIQKSDIWKYDFHSFI